MGMFKCPYCPERFKTRKWLAFHIWKIHGKG
jgi:uncharacterized C2H2 Zn-finger protein